MDVGLLRGSPSRPTQSPGLIRGRLLPFLAGVVIILLIRILITQ
jgi:hypothetical protein